MCCPGAYLSWVMVEQAAERAAESFRVRGPWIGGDLQTLRNYLVGRPADLSAWPERALILEMDDGVRQRVIYGDCFLA